MISIIVPVYQAASYISVCIQSVLQQTWKDFELILVDDGSTDQTREICDRFLKSDSRIRRLVQDHKGVSAARNAGMREAKGEYLFFLDSDDAIHPELLERMYTVLRERQAVIAACNYHELPSGNFAQVREGLDRNILETGLHFYLNNQEFIKTFIYGKGLNIWSAIGGKMVRRSSVKGIWFDEELSNAEDTKYIYELLERGADAVMLPCCGYYYRRRNGSASGRQNIEAYKSIYACDCYIRDREITYGRLEDALQWEWYIVSKIAQWRTSCRMCENEMLKNYILKLEETERSSGYFKKLRIRRRLELMLALYCYPAYEICCALRKLWFELTGL